MPVMDGLEATECIRSFSDEGGPNCAYFRDIPIIALTANAISGTKEMFLQNGFNDFLSKPIDTIKLNALIEKWIPKAKQQKISNENFGAVSKESQDIIAQSIKHVECLEGVKSGVGRGVKSIEGVERIEIKGIDSAKGIAMIGGKPKIYLRILRTYYKNVNEKIEEIKACLNNGDIDLLIIHVHALKSASGSIGADEISKAAFELESAGQRQDLGYIKANVGKFLTDLEELLKNIHPVIQAQDAESQKKEVDKELLKAELAALKAAINDYDIDAINKHSGSLQKYSTAENIGESIGKILQSKMIGEYDEAVEMIDTLLNTGIN